MRWFAKKRRVLRVELEKRQSNYHTQGNLINPGPKIPSNIVDSQCRYDINQLWLDIWLFAGFNSSSVVKAFSTLTFDVDLFSLQSLHQLPMIEVIDSH